MLVIISIGVLTFVLSLLLTPFVRNTVLRFGLVDQPDNFRKIHKTPIPRLGGVAIVLSYGAAIGILKLLGKWSVIHWPGTFHISWLAVAAMVVVCGTGFIDDVYGLNAWQKLSGQVAAAILAYASGVQIHMVHARQVDWWVSLPLTVAWLTVCSNAVNLIDGMDGLAAGIGFVATSTIFAAGFAQHNLGLAMVTLPLCGALLGFLRYNFNPASIFLGDCGSLSVGFLLGCFGVLWTEKSATVLGMTAPVMLLAVPLLDASVSIVRRYLRNQPILAGDRRHLHHRLLDLGLTHRKAVMLLYAGCALAALFSLIQTMFQDQLGVILLVILLALACVAIESLGYIEFGAAAKLLGGKFRKLVDLDVRLRLFEERLGTAVSLVDCWTTIHAAAPEFGFEGVSLRIGQTRMTDFIASSPGGWQVRIPLGDREYINFHGSSAQDHPVDGTSAFVSIVERHLSSKPFVSPKSPDVLERKGPQPAAGPLLARGASGSNKS